MYPIVEKVELSSKPINARFEAYCLSASVKVQSFRLEKGAPANATFAKKVAQNDRSCQFGARKSYCFSVAHKSKSYQSTYIYVLSFKVYPF